MLSEELGTLISDHSSRQLDPDVEHSATRAFVDWVGAVLAGIEQPPAVALRRIIEPLSPGAPSLVVGTSAATDPRTAALVNATAAHSLEVDDIYRDGLYHPGAPTIAAALAVAQAQRSNGSTLLRSVAIGYEVGCRIAKALGPPHFQYFHPTGTVGVIGAAAAAASVLRLDEERACHALALAATMSAGLQQSFRRDAMAKPLHAGHAAGSGVLAAQLAGEGFTGAIDIFEGEAGLGRAMAHEVEWHQVVEDWENRWAISDITVKTHAACGHAFAIIDAALGLRSQHSFDLADIDNISAETATIATQVAGIPNPRTSFEAKFSISYCLAAALTFGTVGLDVFDKKSLNNPTVRALMARTSIVSTPEFDSVFPQRRGGRVVLALRNSEALTEERWTRKGDPDNPLTDDEVSDKFRALSKASERPSMENGLKRLWQIAAEGDLGELFEFSNL